MSGNSYRIDATYESWAQLASRLALPAMGRWQKVGDDPSLLVSSHGISADRLEAFARPLLLGSLAGAAGDIGVRSHAEEELHVGVESGLLSRSSHAWPRPAENSQAIPEAASLAVALWVDGHALWKSLSERESDALIDWFRECAQASERRLNNWRLFGVTIAKFLESVGATSHSLQRTVETGLAAVNAWYDDGGWYSDGKGHTFDYYNSFAFHFYPPLLGFLSDDDAMRDQYAPRLEKYLADLKWLIDSEGAPVYFGRSLTYRFAIAAPFSMAPIVGLNTVNKGYLETATSCANYFLERGAMDQEGLVQRGWHGSDDATAQRYSGELASYWFAKSFVHLLAPKDGDYWTSSSPATPLSGSHLVDSPGFLVSRRAEGRPVLMINHATYDRTSTDLRLSADDPQYSRLEYSSVTAPTSRGHLLTNAVALSARNGKEHFYRARPITYAHGDCWVGSEWLMRRGLNPSNNKSGRSALVRKVVARLRRTRAISSVSRKTAPKVFIASGFLGDWAIHVIRIRGRVPADGILSYVGWGVDGPATIDSPEREVGVAFQSSNFDARLIPILGWHHEQTTDQLATTALAAGPRATVIRGQAKRGRIYVMASGLFNADAIQTHPQFVVRPRGSHLEVRLRGEPAPLLLPSGSNPIGEQIDIT